MQYTEESLAGKRILVTGGAGFIGSNLAAYFQENHPESQVVVFDCFRKNDSKGSVRTLGHYKNLVGFKGEVITGNTNNAGDMKRLAQDHFDIIFHHATLSDTTCEDQELMLRANTNAFHDILKIAKAHGAKVIYASSAGIYGKTPALNIVGKNEKPETVYSFSKLMMDNIARQYAEANPGMHIVGLRYFNVYGRREFYKGKMASMVLQLGLQALNHKKARLFKYGEQKRDFVYIEDVVQANVKAMFAENGIYNVGTGMARTFNDIIHILKEELGEFETEYIDNPWSFYQEHTEADISLTQRYLDYEPNYSLEKGIRCYSKTIRELHTLNASPIFAENL